MEGHENASGYRGNSLYHSTPPLPLQPTPAPPPPPPLLSDLLFIRLSVC